MKDQTPSEQIDQIIESFGGWKGDVIKQIRGIIKDADPTIVEEIKWKMKTRPEGLPVWSQNGIVCYIETWKDNTKLLFAKGAQLDDPNKLFNARLNSSSLRAIEFYEGDLIDEEGVKALVFAAVTLNNGK